MTQSSSKPYSEQVRQYGTENAPMEHLPKQNKSSGQVTLTYTTQFWTRKETHTFL